MRVQLDNEGVFGRQAYIGGSPSQASGLLGLEYPIGQPYEHIFGGGIWVGGYLDTARVGTSVPVRAVSTAYEGWSGPLNEFFPGTTSQDSIWRIFGRNTPKPPNWDSYWGGAIPYNPISDADFYMTYTDTQRTDIAGHIPLNLKVIQSSYAWDDPYADAIMILEYRIINMGRKVIDSAYVGFFFEADVGPISAPLYYQRNFTGYYPNLRTAYIHNPVDRGSTPVGCALLTTSLPLDSLRYSFNWYPGPQSPTPDANRYLMLSGGEIDPDEFPSLSDTRFLFGFGPFFIKPSRDSIGLPAPDADTLKIAVAIISGFDPAGNHLRALQRNASRALDIYLNQGIRLPATPPSPPLRATVGFRRVTLDWKWTPADSVGGGRTNPEQNWDSTNQVARRYADRITNPPPGYDPSRGGRNFSAYKIWRSEAEGRRDESGVYRPPPRESWTLIQQIDVPTDSFEYNNGTGPGGGPYGFNGLEPSTFVDSNLVRGKVYWYSVTSKSIPNLAYQQIVIGGQVVTVEVPVDPLESSIATNAVRIDLPFSVSTELGKVSVVPNPYRTDKTYTLESGGYEGTNLDWDENKRVVKFINLPEVCTIRVFSLSGDLVRTIRHDGREQYPRGDATMALVSDSNRALASGIYIFTVESDLGVQTGKFVIIR